jgi:hypothetical protein
MLEFCDAILDFCPREIAKIADRVKRFEEVRRFWNRETETREVWYDREAKTRKD